MNLNRSAATCSLAATLLTAGIVFGGMSGSASADDPVRHRDAKQGEYVEMASTTVGIDKLQGFVAEDDVVLTDFTPRQPNARLQFRDGGYSVPMASGAGAGSGAPGSYKAGPGCMVQCITHGVAYARGVDSELMVWTDTPAKIVIIVWNDFGYFRSFASDTGEQFFSGFFDDLEPGSAYYAEAFATDSEGYTSKASGRFVTLTRNVEITIDHAEILNQPYDNPFIAHFNVEGEWLDGVNTWLGTLPEDSWVALGKTYILNDTDQHLELMVQLMQHKVEGACEGQAFDDGPEESLVGFATCARWATALLSSGSDDLDDRPADATSWSEHTLHRTLVLPGDGGALPSGSGQPLDFVVPVTLEVTYN